MVRSIISGEIISYQYCGRSLDRLIQLWRENTLKTSLETSSFFVDECVDECKEPGVPCTREDAQELSGDTTLPVPQRTLVDVRAGIENNQWKVWLWGRNVTDEYYWTRYRKVNDSIIRLPAMPRTYGITASYIM